MTRLEGIRAVFSSATLLSAALSLIVFSVASNLRFAACLIALLYAHELGHVLAAMALKVPVRRPPFFIPGLGAFVQLDQNIRAWDRVVICFAGPVAGGIAALGLKLLSTPGWASFAGPAAQFALTINLLNLMPFKPLDGGHIAVATGAISLIPALLLGIFVVLWFNSLLMKLIAVAGVVASYQAANREPEMEWLPRVGVFVLYLITLVLMIVAFGTGGMPSFDDQLRPTSLVWRVPEVLVPIFLLALAGAAAASSAIRLRSRKARVVLMTFGALPAYLLSKPLMVPAWFGLLGMVLGLDTEGWLRRYVLWLTAKDPEAAGMTASWAFDVLEDRGDESRAEQWLANVVGGAANPILTATTYSSLYVIGRRDRALAWAKQVGEGFDWPRGADPVTRNNIAWMLYQLGRPDDALPVARSAVDSDPRNANLLDTLGRILEARGDYEEAERVLRDSLGQRNDPYARVALAKALAGQGRYREALPEARSALARIKSRQRPDEPSPDVIRGWMVGWQAKAAEGTENPEACPPQG